MNSTSAFRATRQMLSPDPDTVIRARLRQAGLRPTSQRMQLGALLFGSGHRHVTAEMLYIESREAHSTLSLATVYNTLAQFCEAGLLRQLHTGHSCAVYDTDVKSNSHFIIGTNGPIIDLPVDDLQFVKQPEPPAGYRIAGIDIVVRLEPDGEAHEACADIAP